MHIAFRSRLSRLAGLFLALAVVRAAPATQEVQLPETEPVLRIEIVPSMAEAQFELEGTWKLEQADASPTPEAPEVAWELVALLGHGDALSLRPGDGPLGLTLTGATGAQQIVSDHVRLVAVEPAEARVLVRAVPYGQGWWWAGTEDRHYAGPLEFHRWPTVAPPGGHPGFGTVADDGVQIVAVVAMEEYLRGVVPREIGSGAPPAALRAQAVAARTYTLHRVVGVRSLHPGSNVDACADVHCMVYGGTDPFDEASDRAIEMTRGEVLLADGLPVDAVFASNCGGWTEAAENVWPERAVGPGQPIAGLRPLCDAPEPLDVDLTQEDALHHWVDDPPGTAWCSAQRPGLPEWTSRNWRWERALTPDDLKHAQAKLNTPSEIVGFEPLERGPSGRLIALSVNTSAGNHIVGPELAIRQLFDPPLRSAACYFDQENGGWVVRGAGWGHGVGLCQTGAIGQALAGRSHDEILAHYYQGASLVHLWD